MYKIGFLGSDNSHVEKFCEILNLSNHEKFWSNSGAKVTGIWGEDNELTKKMASYGEIKNIETNPESLVSNSDIVFVITRRPEKHLEYAKFAIDQKKPLFVEKPVTQTINEAKTLINLVEKSNIIMTSFSESDLISSMSGKVGVGFGQQIGGKTIGGQMIGGIQPPRVTPALII